MEGQLGEKPLVSVIIPVYNVEAWLPACLDSVLAQTLASIEVICVNDCSPDGTLDALKRAAAADEHVTAIDLARNGGRHSALMCGCHYAQGDYVVFVDDDQQCPLDRLWDLLAPLLDGSADVAIARYPKKQQYLPFVPFVFYIKSIY